MCRTSFSWSFDNVVAFGVDALAAAFASFTNPNRHAMVYTLKGPASVKVFRASLRAGYIDVLIFNF